MPITMKDVRTWLDAEEVDYNKAKTLGAAALPFLMELVQGGDLGLASKATYLTSLIKSPKSAAVLAKAAARSEPVVRVAAASAIRNLSEVQAGKLLDLLKDDPDAGIRKVMLKSAERLRSPKVAAKVQRMAKADPEPFVRELAASTVASMTRKRK